MPGSAYTEQSGYFTNLEGKLQKAFKASYPPGNAKEDWQIINELSETINSKKLFNDKAELESAMLNNLNLFKENNLSKKHTELTNLIYENEKITVKYNDYYYSNSIARSSKTMSNCRNEKTNLKLTGTEG